MDPDQFHPVRFLNENIKYNNTAAYTIPSWLYRQCLTQLKLKAICVCSVQHVTFCHGGREVNAGEYVDTNTILPKNIVVMLTFD